MDEQDDDQRRPRPPYGALDHDPFAERPLPVAPGLAPPREPGAPGLAPPASQPPQKKGGVWKALALVFGTILTLELVAVVALITAGVVWASNNLAGHQVEEALEKPCRNLSATAAEVRPLVGPRASAEPLQRLASAADVVATTAARAASSDADDRYAEDWRRVASALGSLAADPEGTYSVPRRDGVPVTVSLAENGPAECAPPPVITLLDPDASAGLALTEADDL